MSSNHNAPALPGLGGGPQFNEFEHAAVQRVAAHLDNPKEGPLLTINEEDIIIEVDSLYFGKIEDRYTPKNALQRVASGEFTQQDIEHKRRSARAIVRKDKSDMYVDRVITATYAADTCRALYRALNMGIEVIPVEADDTIAHQQHRVGDYVTDMLEAARESRLLRGAAMQTTVERIRQKFDTDPAAQLALTALAGKNTMKKVDLWLNQLLVTSRGFERLTSDSKAKLMTYAAGRPAELQEKFNLLQLLADKKKAQK